MKEETKNQSIPAGFGHRGGPPLGRAVEKPKDFKGTLKRLLQYLKPQKYLFVVVFFFTVVSTLFGIVTPKILGEATTKVVEGLMNKARGGSGIDFGFIGKLGFILIMLYLASSVFNYLMGYIMAGVAQKIVFKMRNDLYGKLSRLPLKFFDSRSQGEILSRITNDMDNIGTTLQQSMTQLISAIVTILGVLVMMIIISPLLTLISIVTLPLAGFATMKIAKRSQLYFADQQKSIGQLSGHVDEMFSGHKMVKAFSYEEKSIEKFEKINDELYNSGWKAQFISGIIFPLLGLINNLGYVLICIAGGIMVTRHSIKIGDIQAFIQYTKHFTHPIVQTANISNIIQSTIASAERVFEILDEKEEADEADNPEFSGEIYENLKFENLKFSYKKESKLIENLNLKVSKGDTLAIVGPTGAGKTTLVNLMLRFYELDGGSITIDGNNIKNMKRENLRRMFGMVLQDTWLFNGTIRDNIAYGKENATVDEILAVSKAAHADHFIRTLPHGYDTVLDEDASNISQGQKQLLTIARALLADSPVLILDEATSSVDTRTENYIQNAMTRLMKGRTNFVIAHRLSTIKDADHILVMDHGSIIELGNHKSLMAQKGFYSELYNSQFKGNGAV
jgi:ATP-binding cassette subfamily B protein